MYRCKEVKQIRRKILEGSQFYEVKIFYIKVESNISGILNLVYMCR
jgi:hypothetical protein